MGKRRPFIAFGLAGAIPGLLGLALAPSFGLIALSCFVLGFFLVSVNPTGTQYASEISLPTPEGSSNGLISLAGQVSVVLVYAMEPVRKLTGSSTLPLLCFAGLLVGALALAASLKEPATHKREMEAGAMARGGKTGTGKAGSVKGIKPSSPSGLEAEAEI